MTDLRKAAEMALDALDAWLVADVTKLPIVIPQTENTVFALRQALAQSDPVVNEKDGSPCPEFWDWLPKAYNFEGNGTFTKYNMEVAFLAGKNTAIAQPEQEPVDIHCPSCLHSFSIVPVAKRQWVSLTEKERRTFASWLDDKTDDEVFNAIEAKLKERNNG